MHSPISGSELRVLLAVEGDMKIILVVSIAFLFSCTGVLVNIPKNELQSRSLAVATFLNCEIHYQGDVQNELGPGDQDLLIRNYLQKSILKGLESKSCFDTVKECDYLSLEQPGLDSLKNIRRFIRYLKTSPRSGSFSCNSDVLLLFDNVRLSSSMIFTLDGSSNIVTRSLMFSCDYAYWGTRDSSVLARGKIEHEVVTTKPMIEMVHWKRLTNGIVTKLLVNDEYAK
jgi:hypothetical protein